MKVVLLRRDDDGAVAAPLPDGLALRMWQADGTAGPRRGRFWGQNWVWRAMARLGMFAAPGLVELALIERGETVARLILTPRWFRFPFMAAGELQAGAVWVHPARRRRGLAEALLRHACAVARGMGAARVWYLCAADHAASRGLAARCGFGVVAQGRRTRRWGLRLLGSFMVE